MTVIPPGFAEARLSFSIPGDAGPAMVVFGFEPADPDPNAIAPDILQAFQGTLLTQLAQTVVLSEVEVTVGQDGGPPIVGGVSSGGPGGINSDATPPNTAYLIQKRTVFGGSAYRGRMFLPGVIEERVENDGLLTPTAYDMLQDEADAFLTRMTTEGNPLVLLHGDPTLDPTPIAALNVAQKVATQRRRLR